MKKKPMTSVLLNLAIKVKVSVAISVNGFLYPAEIWSHVSDVKIELVGDAHVERDDASHHPCAGVGSAQNSTALVPLERWMTKKNKGENVNALMYLCIGMFAMCICV